MFVPDSITWMPIGLRRLAYGLLWRQELETLRRKRTVDTRDGYSFLPFDQHRCIFVHIPKAAGISVSTSLFGNLSGAHTSLGIYQLLFSDREFSEYFKFTFVRNPWDRLYSAYSFLKRGGLNPSDRAWSSEHLSGYATFGDFVRRWVTPRNVKRYLHFVPQKNYLCLPGRQEVGVDFVGYFENIAADYLAVQKRISACNAQPLQHKNKTRHRENGGYQAAYDDETRAIVADVYADDIRLFGYDFGNVTLPSVLNKRRVP